MSVVKIRQRSLPEAHVKKKNKFDVFKFYLNVRFWAWKKKPQLIAVYIYMYTYFYWFHEMLWSMEYVICVWVYFTFL